MKKLSRLENEVLEEIREYYEVDPGCHLKIMFARLYVRNPVRVLTYTNLRPRQLLNVKDLTVAGTPLKYITIHQQKTNTSARAAKVLSSTDEYEVWKMIIGDLNPVYAVDKTLRSHIKTAIEKGCGYKLKDIRFLCQACNHNRAMFLKSLAAHFNNSERCRNYVSVCSRLFKAANSEDIKDSSAPNVIQMAILDSNCMVKTKMEYLGCVKEIKRLV